MLAAICGTVANNRLDVLIGLYYHSMHGYLRTAHLATMLGSINFYNYHWGLSLLIAVA